MHLLLEATKSNCWVTICMKNVCGFIIMQKVSDTPARTNETFLEKTNLPFAAVSICSLFSCVLHHFTTLGMSIPAWESLCCPVSCDSWNKCSGSKLNLKQCEDTPKGWCKRRENPSSKGKLRLCQHSTMLHRANTLVFLSSTVQLDVATLGKFSNFLRTTGACLSELGGNAGWHRQSSPLCLAWCLHWGYPATSFF